LTPSNPNSRADSGRIPSMKCISISITPAIPGERSIP
jgi:hypothetical protein